MNNHNSNNTSPCGHGNGKGGQSNESRMSSGQEIPTLRIQAGTPVQISQATVAPTQQASSLSQVAEKNVALPPIPTTQSSPRSAVSLSSGQNENGTQKPVFATPQVPALPSSHGKSNPFQRQIKRDMGTGYGPQCIGYGQNNIKYGLQNSSGIRLEPMNISLKLPNSILQNQSPTPSDVSSIRLTPRNNILSPDRNSVMTPRSPIDKNGFLEPKPAIKQEWGTYKVLPSLNSHQNPAMSESSVFIPPYTPRSSLSQYAGSSNSLSPFPNFEHSPSGSHFASPRHSARSNLSLRMGTKRALSISPLSGDGLDLNQLIRTSPTSLVAYINGSRGSSVNVSPQPMVLGALGHQIGSRPNSGSTRFNFNGNNLKKEPPAEMPYYQMGTLEQQRNMDTRGLSQNHLVMHADNVQYMEQNQLYKQEPVDPYSHTQMPPTNQRPPRPPVHPPPSYQQAVQNKGQNDVGNNDSKEDEENKQLCCKWIDCNQIFQEQDELVRHIEKVHIDQRKGEDFTCFWHSCPRRYKSFNARYKLLIHMRVHSGEKPNRCTFEGCNKAFSRLENLKIHLRSHTGERPYHCQHQGCNKCFSNSSDRAKHQRTHLDTKPYACNVPGCNKRYTDPSSLRKHHKNHTQKEQQQARKKIRGNKDDGNYSNETGNMLNDCLQIHQLRREGSPMDMSPHSSCAGSHPGSSSDMYPALPYSSNHSSRSGTANGGLSSHPSPASVQGSPMGHPVVMDDSSNDSRNVIPYNSPMISPGRRVLPPIMNNQARKLPSGGVPSPHVSPRQGLPPPPYQQQQMMPAQTMTAQTMNGYQPPYDMNQQQSSMTQHYNQMPPEYMMNNGGQVNNKFYEIQLVQQQNQPMNDSQINVNYTMMRQPSPRNFMQIPTFEEDLKSITTLSNHSGFSDQQQTFDMYSQQQQDLNANDANQFLQLNAVDRCNSQLSAIYADGSA